MLGGVKGNPCLFTHHISNTSPIHLQYISNSSPIPLQYKNWRYNGVKMEINMK